MLKSWACKTDETRGLQIEKPRLGNLTMELIREVTPAVLVGIQKSSAQPSDRRSIVDLKNAGSLKVASIARIIMQLRLRADLFIAEELAVRRRMKNWWYYRFYLNIQAKKIVGQALIIYPATQI